MSRALTAIVSFLGGGVASVYAYREFCPASSKKGGSCSSDSFRGTPENPCKAVCMLSGDKGVSGTVSIECDGQYSRLTGSVTGLAPGKHGFHIHHYGDLTQGCASTKGHYNPFNKNHGGPNDEDRHVGDLGNITADENGVANVDIKDKLVTLCGPYSVIGRAIVVHRDEDDLGKGGFPDSLTTGHAGPRLACGVIGLAYGDPR